MVFHKLLRLVNELLSPFTHSELFIKRLLEIVPVGSCLNETSPADDQRVSPACTAVHPAEWVSMLLIFRSRVMLQILSQAVRAIARVCFPAAGKCASVNNQQHEWQQ